MPARYFEALVPILDARGVRVDALVEGAGIGATTLAAPDAHLTIDEVEALVLRASALAGGDALALELGFRFLKPSHGPIGIAVMTAKDVKSAIATTFRYLPFTMPLFEPELELEGAPLRVRLHPRFPLDPRVDRFLRTALSASFHAHTALLMGGVLASAVELDMMQKRPESLPAWVESSGVPVRFDRPAYEVRVSAELATRPMPLADANAHDAACRTCDALLASQPDPERHAASVRHRLTKSGPPFPDVESVARMLGATPRTIGRRLAQEGTTFRAILDEVRMAQAEAWLAQGNRSITEIGFELGYSDTANFTRAYRRIHGRSPSSGMGRVARAQREKRDIARED